MIRCIYIYRSTRELRKLALRYGGSTRLVDALRQERERHERRPSA